MKTIPNKSVRFEGSDKDTTYADLLRVCLRNVPQGGFDPETMRKRMRALDQIDASEKNKEERISLEDADHAEVVACVNVMKWGILDKAILGFIDCVNSREN